MAQADISVEVVNLYNSKAIWAHFASVAAYLTRLRLTAYLRISDIQIVLP